MKKLLLLLLALTPFVLAQSAVIYKSESCGHCTPYVQELYGALEENGFQNIQVKDFLNDRQARAEVAALQKEFNVPLEMQGHLLTLLEDGKGEYLFQGHFPVGVVQEFLQNERQNYEKITATQDSMEPNPPGYLLLAPDGSVKQCGITQKISECEKQGVANGVDSLLKFKIDSNALILILLGLVLVALVLLYAGVLK